MIGVLAVAFTVGGTQPSREPGGLFDLPRNEGGQSPLDFLRDQGGQGIARAVTEPECDARSNRRGGNGDP